MMQSKDNSGKQSSRIPVEENKKGKSLKPPVQKKEKNNPGLPDNLKSGVENLSGISMDDVKVHYNSSQPAQLNAHAYAQGNQIHIAPGQEKHLPHEAWHVVQQKQGRVRPTMQMKGKVNVNDDKGLEKEADVMGGKAVKQLEGSDHLPRNINTSAVKIFQRVIDGGALTLALIGETAAAYGLHVWDNDKFITYENADDTVFEVHVHNYGIESDNENHVKLTGHIIWKKQFGSHNRNQRPFAVEAERVGGRWDARLELGEERIDIPNAILTDGRTRLEEEVVGNLADIVKDALNDN